MLGIAAADVICCSRLGRHARGDSHDEAATLLASADREAVKHLQALLRMKTKAGYGHTSATKDEVKRAGRAADALVEKARRARALGAAGRSTPGA
jgi:superfamily II DNA/RNA helicase